MSGKYSDEEYRDFILRNDYIAGLDSPFCYEYERAMQVKQHDIYQTSMIFTNHTKYESYQ